MKRPRTNAPMQALVLLNDPQVVEASRMVAARMLRETGPGLDDRITYPFRLLTTHRPAPEELALIRNSYEEKLAGVRANRAAALDLLGIRPRCEPSSSCGEAYSDEETTTIVLETAHAAFDRGAEVEILTHRTPRAA
jgi:hypothetical protein